MNTVHEIVEIKSPASVTLRCSCGWCRQFDRRQNALARAAKVRAAKNKHWQETESASQDDMT